MKGIEIITVIILITFFTTTLFFIYTLNKTNKELIYLKNEKNLTTKNISTLQTENTLLKQTVANLQTENTQLSSTLNSIQEENNKLKNELKRCNHSYNQTSYLSINLSKNSFSLGENLNAVLSKRGEIFISNSGSCSSPWEIFMKKNSSWIEISKDIFIDCIPICENQNIIPTSCSRNCSRENRCYSLDSAPLSEKRFTWDLKRYEIRQENCSGSYDLYAFKSNTPLGQYKIRYTYYTENRCSDPKISEVLFNIT